MNLLRVYNVLTVNTTLRAYLFLYVQCSNALRLFTLSNILDASKHPITTLRFTYGFVKSPRNHHTFSDLSDNAAAYTLRCFVQIHLFILSLLPINIEKYDG